MFPFEPDPDKVQKRGSKGKEIIEFFDRNPSLQGKLYYESVFHEYGGVDDHVPASEILSMLRKGAQEEYDAACAAKLLFVHIEPCKLNNGLPDYDCDAGLSTVLKIIKKKGIFDYIDHETKTMPLVHMMLNYLDLSVVLRDNLIKR